MSVPPRLSHLATRSVLVAKLFPTYALAHHLDDDEARSRLERALAGRLWNDLLTVTWEGLSGGAKRLSEEGLLEKVAQSLKDRPLRPGRAAALTPGWSAFLVLADLEAGTASDSVRRALDSPDGKARLQAGLKEVGGYLARELTRQ